jgi:NADPH:quinone reductase-like Zn-dependent oxidoreductase
MSRVEPLLMRALSAPRYGVFSAAPVPRPSPNPDRPITVKVSRASLNFKDIRIANADPFLVRLYAGLRRPFPEQHGVLGCDFSGIVHAIHDPASTDLVVGDRVMGCIDEAGAAAEFVNAAPRHLARVPASVSLEAAACGGIAALTALIALDPAPREGPGAEMLGEDNPVSASTREWIRDKAVLVTGASGGVGLFSVQLAKALGAVVTGVCGPSSAAVVRLAGADAIVDYTTTTTAEIEGTFDVIVDTANYATPISVMRGKLNEGGRYHFIGGNAYLSCLMGCRWNSTKERPMSTLNWDVCPTDMPRSAGMLREGLVNPIISARFSIEDGVEALRLLETCHAKGKIVLVIDDSLE